MFGRTSLMVALSLPAVVSPLAAQPPADNRPVDPVHSKFKISVQQPIAAFGADEFVKREGASKAIGQLLDDQSLTKPERRFLLDSLITGLKDANPEVVVRSRAALNRVVPSKADLLGAVLVAHVEQGADSTAKLSNAVRSVATDNRWAELPIASEKEVRIACAMLAARFEGALRPFIDPGTKIEISQEVERGESQDYSASARAKLRIGGRVVEASIGLEYEKGFRLGSSRGDLDQGATLIQIDLAAAAGKIKGKPGLLAAQALELGTLSIPSASVYWHSWRHPGQKVEAPSKYYSAQGMLRDLVPSLDRQLAYPFWSPGLSPDNFEEVMDATLSSFGKGHLSRARVPDPNPDEILRSYVLLPEKLGKGVGIQYKEVWTVAKEQDQEKK